MNKNNLHFGLKKPLLFFKKVGTFLDLNFYFWYIQNMSQPNFQKCKKLCITKKVAPPQNKKILKTKKSQTECINSSRLDLSYKKVLQKKPLTF